MSKKTNKDLPKDPNPMDIEMTPELEKAMAVLRIDEIVKSLYVDYPFYGRVLSRVTKTFSKDVPTAAVSLKKELFVNRMFMASLPKKQQMGIIEHEVLHLALLHLKRFYVQFKDPTLAQLANIATDCAINQLVHYPLPDWVVNVDTIKQITGRNDIKEMETGEYYFALLMEKKEEYEKKIEEMMKCKSCDGTGDHQDCDGKGCGDCEDGDCPDCGGDGLSDFGKAMKSIAEGHGKSVQESENESGTGIDPAAESAMRNLLQKAKEEQDKSDRNAGTEPGDYFSKILPTYVTLDKRVWKRAISRAVGTTPVADTKCIYNRPNRRCADSNWGKRHRLENNKLYVGIDSSASISDHELQEFCGHISKAIKSCDLQIDLIVCDYSIQDFKPGLKSLSYKKGIEVKGRGGTDLTKIIDLIEEREGRKKSRLVLMTDGYTDWRETPTIDTTVIYTKDHSKLNYSTIKYDAVLEASEWD